MTIPPPKTTRDLEDFAGIASDWFWETDADHRFTYFSSRMEDVTGMRSDAILGKRRNQMKAVGHEGSCIDQHTDDLANCRPFRNFEYKLKRDIGQGHFWLRVAGDPIFAPDGTFLGYRGTGHDITVEKESIARLAAMNDALAKQITFDDDVFSIGVSVGVALSYAVPTSPRRLIASADAALYAAKGQGRNCVRKALA
jgi:PAS domain S-box-containing protein